MPYNRIKDKRKFKIFKLDTQFINRILVDEDYKLVIKEFRGSTVSIDYVSLKGNKSFNFIASIIEDNDCAMYTQISKQLFKNEGVNNFSLIDVILKIDFSGNNGCLLSCQNKSLKDKAEKLYKKGLTIEFSRDLINQINTGDIAHNFKTSYHFVNFEYGPSMAKDSCITFIDESIKAAIENNINVDIPLNEGKYCISKINSYKGLMFSGGLSAGTIESLGLNENTVVIIKDKEILSDKIKYVTAVNIKEAFNIINNEINSGDINYNNIVNIFDTFNLLSEEDFKEISLDDKINYIKEAIESKQEFSSLEEIANYIASKHATDSYSFASKFPNKIDILRVWKRVELEGQIAVNCFDGEGLISPDFKDQLVSKLIVQEGENNLDFDVEEALIEKATTLQIRMPFIKGMVHVCDFQAFFRDHRVNKIVDYKGIERDITKVKLILTESQFKAKKWIEKYPEVKAGKNALTLFWEKLKTYKHEFYIILYNKDDMNDQDVLNYQFLNTPMMTNEEFMELRKPFEEKLVKLATEKETRVKFVSEDKNALYEDEDNGIFYEQEESFFANNPINKKLVKLNPDFVFFKPIKKQIDDERENLLNKYSIGKINIFGEQRYLSGDLLDFLYYAAGINGELKDDLSLNENQFYVPRRENESIRFNPNKPYAVLRNPHLTRNEDVLLLPWNGKKGNERDLYFSKLNGLIMINAKSLVAERLSGADYDGDVVRIIKNEVYNNSITKHFIKKSYLPNDYKYPLIKMAHTEAPEEEYTDENKLKTIKHTFSSRVGEINNDSFKISIDVYNENKVKTAEDLDNEKKVELFALITSLEIDSSKSGLKPYYPTKNITNKHGKYFITYKNSMNLFSSASLLVDDDDFDCSNSFKSILNRQKGGKAANNQTCLIKPDKKMPNIVILPALKQIIKKPVLMPETDMLPNFVFSQKKEKMPKYSKLFAFENKLNTVNKDNLLKFLALVNAYNHVSKDLSDAFRDFKAYNNDKNRGQEELELIQNILGKQGKDDKFDMFKVAMDTLYISSEDATSIFDKLKNPSNYGIKKWAFTLKEERLSFIKQLFGDRYVEGLEDFEEGFNFYELLSNFSHSGYLLLCYVLQYKIRMAWSKENVLLKLLSECLIKEDYYINDRIIESAKNFKDLGCTWFSDVKSNINVNKLSMNYYHDLLELCYSGKYIDLSKYGSTTQAANNDRINNNSYVKGSYKSAIENYSLIPALYKLMKLIFVSDEIEKAMIACYCLKDVFNTDDFLYEVILKKLTLNELNKYINVIDLAPVGNTNAPTSNLGDLLSKLKFD